MINIKVKVIRPGSLPERHGDWVDLKAGITIKYKKGDFVMIPLGVAMKLPQGYEGHLLPRSSTFKKYKILLVNSTGIIDNAYCGNGDEWQFPAIAMEDGVIKKGDRIAQFRAVPVMKAVKFSVREDLGSKDRGGFGSTGI